ncbi:ribonuclease H-like domain-containing protein [Tanacetum coccineum]|uniref:Ribonuclease H-like domain-containing protein n=1 Tax=Tanacetum coccineum TaxID=301880 RepID=A0ABQ4WXF0_9ASTR
MTGNMSYLSDFKEFDGGYVTFGGGAKGLHRTHQTIGEGYRGKKGGRSGVVGDLIIEEELLVKELLKLVLLKVPRKNNMYSVDMKNIVPKESLTCLVAKSTLDESMLWHRRLGKATQSLFLMNKKYCLVVTDDYSRFTWVFLETKDETGGILKSFITEIENLVDKKVKVIRCDNGTEFRNEVIVSLYEIEKT